MLKDSFGRTFPYIRMSITDVCNFKCGYCLPNGYQIDKSDNRKFLHLDEIKRLAKCFSELGVNKIRITGGEPTVRKDFFEIIKVLKVDAVAVAGDVSQMQTGEDVIAAAVNNWGSIDGVVCVAGILRERMLFNMSEDEWDPVIAVHLKGHFTKRKKTKNYSTL